MFVGLTIQAGMCMQMNRDVPGIDAAFLAIDTDDAVEFVWNEVRYSNRKVVKESKVCCLSLI